MAYVIVGAGPAGVIAAETLRKNDPDSPITLIGGEDEAPYSRMAIPYYLEGNIAEEGTHLRKQTTHYADLKVEYLRGARVTGLDTAARQLTLADGHSVPYDKLLLATGSHPTRPPVPGIDLPGVLSCWTLADARAIKPQIAEGAHVVLIGAGFIGTIILDAIGSQKLTLTVIEAESRMTPRMMDETGGAVMQSWCDTKGVRVLASTRVEALEEGGERKFTLRLSNGETLAADLVVTATGVLPNIDFLAGSGIETDQGILVDEHLQSSVPGIYAAGDVAQGRDFSLGERFVHAIQPTAAEHGQIAALNMAGKDAAYRGSLIMNTIGVLGLTVYSFGQWMGAESGGERGEFLDREQHRYIRLEFKGDRLIGAIYIGNLEQIGILRGLIQNEIPLGAWKDTLIADPRRIVEAYLNCTDYGTRIPTMRAQTTG